jgi:cytochrome c
MPLALPADPIVIQALLVVLFLGHILLVNLMVGGSVLTLACEIIGLRRPDFDTLAREIAKTVTVNKSLAVVLGVGPLLAINVLYATHFYSANVLTGSAWIMIIPLVTVAFLTAYAHKYTWEGPLGSVNRVQFGAAAVVIAALVLTVNIWLTLVTLLSAVLLVAHERAASASKHARAKRIHIALGGVATALFMLIPFIFLANINLMLFPERWADVRGFLSAVVLPNVVPRYAHFLFACLALTGLFMLVYLTRKGYPVETVFENLDRVALRRGFYVLVFAATFMQFFAGPLVLFTLPTRGLSWPLVAVIGVGAASATVAMVVVAVELRGPAVRLGRRSLLIAALLMCTGAAMGYGRHLYREGAVKPHRDLMVRKTADFYSRAAGALSQAQGAGLDALPLGERTFRQVCSACHAVDRVLAAPALTEIATRYAGAPQAIVQWTRSPGRRRKEFAPMPALPHLSQERLTAVAQYMLDAGAAAIQEDTPPAPETTSN